MQIAFATTYSLPDPLQGSQVGNYLLLRQLGKGGEASVYLAEHIYLKNWVAIKLLNLSSARASALERFQYEAQLLAHLKHQHIVRILDFGWQDGTPFMVMNYAPGGTLKTAFAQNQPLPVSHVMPTVLKIASALQYVHDQGVIHCDVKPDNILLGPSNKIWLTDFGIATTVPSSPAEIYSSAEACGTVHFMAPEQLEGKPLPASDQYALAAMIYRWLSGRYPFEGSAFEVYLSHFRATSPQPLRDHIPSIPSVVEQVMMKALAKDPQQRFQHILEFASALEEASSTASCTTKLQSIINPVPPRCSSFNQAMSGEQTSFLTSIAFDGK